MKTRLARSLLVLALGFFAIVSQTVLFREFLGVFEGNELGVGGFFGSWLLWVAIGAATAGVAGRFGTALTSRFEVLVLVYIPAFVLQHYLITEVRRIAGIEAYLLFPLGRMILLSFAVNAPISFCTGFLFTIACRWWEGQERREQGRRLSVAAVYILEASGGFLGGVLVTLLLYYGTAGEKIILYAMLLISLCAVGAGSRKLVGGLPAVLVLTVLVFSGGGEKWAEADRLRDWGRLLPRDSYRGHFSTIQGQYLYGEREGQFVVVAYGGVCEAVPDPEYASEVAAINMSQCPTAKNVLVVGPSSLSVCAKFLEVPQIRKVTWLHPDCEYPKRVTRILPERLRGSMRRLEIPGTDVRQLALERKERYDLIVLNVPDATTLTRNRYFTKEFFVLIKNILSDGGVTAVRTSGAANYMGGELAYLGASSWETLSSVFRKVVLKPGDDSWLFASDGDSPADSPALLRDRFAGIPGAKDIYPAEWIMSLYPPDRIEFQMGKYREATLGETPGFLINSDDRPKALLFSLLVSLRQAGIGSIIGRTAPVTVYGVWFFVVCIIVYGLLRLIYLLKSRSGHGKRALFDGSFLVFSVGFAGMSFSVVLMFLFQSAFGSLFLYVGMISSLFMLGSLAGGIAAERIVIKKSREGNLLIPGLLALHLLIIAVIVYRIKDPSIYTFAVLFLLSGFFTGCYFPPAAGMRKEGGSSVGASGSILETLDHVGGAFGSVITGLVLLPLFGTAATVGVSALLIGINLPLIGAGRKITALTVGDWFDRIRRPVGYATFGIALTVLITSQIFAWGMTGETSRRFHAVAESMSAGRDMRRMEGRSRDGATLQYYEIRGDVGSTVGYVYSTEASARKVYGFGGPIVMAVETDTKGTLKSFAVVDSNETPVYLRLLAEWEKGLAGRNVFNPVEMGKIDTVSGATVSSRAIVDTLTTSGRVFSKDVLGLSDVAGDISASKGAWSPDRGFVGFAALLILAIALRHRPGKRLRRVFLAAAFLVGGFYLNVQYSLQHVIGFLSGQLPSIGFSGVFLAVTAVPVLVVLFGNFYCGYVCPFGALQELVGECRPGKMRTDPRRSIWRYGRSMKYLLLFFLLALYGVSRSLSVPGADPLVAIFSASRDRRLIEIVVGLLVLSFIYRRFWCRNLCPCGAFLALLGGIGVFRKAMPKTEPGKCDLGVTSKGELDCIQCDRCRYEKN